MKKRKTILSLVLALIIYSACTNEIIESSTELTVEQQNAVNQLILQQQSKPASAIAIVDDITGSYRSEQETLDFEPLFKAFNLSEERVVIGFCQITDNSNDPMLRCMFTPYLEKPKVDQKNTNPWLLSSENEQLRIDIKINENVNWRIDSLNRASVCKFRSRLIEREGRQTAYKSDVYGALKRASYFLGEFPQGKRILIVLSDFKHTAACKKREIHQLDTTISLWVVGNASPKNIFSGTGKKQYRQFENYHEAFNQAFNNIY